MRTISREVARSSSLATALTPQRLHAELLAVSASSSRCYLFGALHDATISKVHRTVRFGQSDERWLNVLAVLLDKIGKRSWVYREGRNRRFWVLEASSSWLDEGFAPASEEDQLAYARGYFDAEGGIPTDLQSRFYVQFVQKNRPDVNQLRDILLGLGIRCGKLHNPSSRVDPDVWRFYVLSESQREFVHRVGSWHPRKRDRLEEWKEVLETRMKI